MMVEFVVIVKKADGKLQGMGSHQFRVPPRVSEHIEMSDDDGIGQIYEVVVVIHPLDMAVHAGDLIIRHVADTTSFHRSL